jgi:hypothetical protein
VKLGEKVPSKASPLRDHNDNSGTEAAWLFVQPLATVPFLTFSAQLEVAFGLQTIIPFDLVSSFTLSSTM